MHFIVIDLCLTRWYNVYYTPQFKKNGKKSDNNNINQLPIN